MVDCSFFLWYCIFILLNFIIPSPANTSCCPFYLHHLESLLQLDLDPVCTKSDAVPVGWDGK